MGSTESVVATATRPFVFPEPGDTIETLAARVLPDEPDGAQLLLSWNLHLVLRTFPVGGPGEVMPTDIVYLSPPPES